MDVEGLGDGAFTAIDYGLEVEGAASPYAQIARVSSRYWCEVASNIFLAGDSWPLHGDVLRAAGWDPPDEDCPNWYSEWSSARAATTAVIHGLRYGRNCTDLGFVEWHAAASLLQMGIRNRFRALFRRTRRL